MLKIEERSRMRAIHSGWIDRLRAKANRAMRQQLPENEEQPIHLLYGFLYVADKEEGLVIIGDPHLKSKSPGVGTLLDGNPANNFLGRAVTFNPGGVLTGARRITIAGTFAYILTDKALVAVDLDNPLAPRITATVGSPALHDPRGIAVQFRYAFVVDHDGLKVLDVTDLARPKPVSGALVPLEDARSEERRVGKECRIGRG